MLRQVEGNNGSWSAYCEVVSLQQAYISQKALKSMMLCSLSTQSSRSSWSTSTMLNALCQTPPRTAAGKACRLPQMHA